MHTFTVIGSGPFPFDMLRYDCCWPYSSEDASRLPLEGRRKVTLASGRRGSPTHARWESFGWKVILESEEA